MLALLVLLFCNPSLADDSQPQPEPDYPQYGKPLAPFYATEPRSGSQTMNFQALKDLIAKNNVKTIEQLIPLLPEEYRRYYTLMYGSRSLQGATPDKPRVIMFGPDARFMIAFTGSTDAKRGSVLETIEWQEDTASFKFRDITFDEKKKTARPKINENPRQCVQCHRGDPRPNWEAYPVWLGAYNSHESTLPGSEEAKGLASYLAGKASNARYASLPDYTVEKEYVHEENAVDASKIPAIGIFSNYLGALNLKRVLRRATDLGGGRPWSKFKFALTATALQCTLNYDFMNTDKDNTTAFSVEELVSPKLKFDRAIKGTPPTYKAAEREVWNAVNANYDRLNAAVAKVNYGYDRDDKTPDGNGTDQHHLIATYHYLFSRMGLNLDDYATTLARHTFAFGTFGDGIGTLSSSIVLKIRMGDDPDFAFVRALLPPKSAGTEENQLTVEKSSPEHVAMCEKLRQLSQRALGFSTPTPVRAAAKPSGDCVNCQVQAQNSMEAEASVGSIAPSSIIRGRAVLEGRCLTCHDGHTSKDFGSKDKLEGYIHEHSVDSVTTRLESKDPAVNMPRDGSLTDQERADLETYLHSVGASAQ